VPEKFEQIHSGGKSMNMNIKYKINEDGNLEIERKGKGFIPQYCPFAEEHCGLYCPMFGEPELVLDDLIELELCKITLVCNERDFKDERKKEEI